MSTSKFRSLQSAFYRAQSFMPRVLNIVIPVMILIIHLL